MFKTTVLMTLAVGMTLAGVAQAGPYDAAVLADNPFVYYRFEEAGGGTANDSSGNANNGTYAGTVNLGQASFAANLGSSGQFTGNDGRIELPALGTYSQHSIEMWVKTNGLAGGCCTSLMHTGWDSDVDEACVFWPR